MKLSEHFTLEEFLRSDTAKRQGIDNTPSAPSRLHMAELCQKILEPVRERYGHPIRITSGYRSPKLNEAIGGARNSQHMTGDAADMVCTVTPNVTLFRLMEKMIKEGAIEVGQLIWERGTAGNPSWIHVSNPRPGRQNNQILYLF